MRKSAALAALFPTIRGDVLVATLTQPEKWWYLSELAAFLHTTPSSLQREMRALVHGGILESRREGTRACFKAETASTLFPELHGLIQKTAGVMPTLRDLLRPFESRIASAFIYGSIARGQEHAQSDVDLLVVSDLGLADLAPALRKAEDRLGREINVTSYSKSEFRKKAAAKEHFLSQVLRGPKQFVRGDESDLERPYRQATTCNDIGRRSEGSMRFEPSSRATWPTPGSRRSRPIAGLPPRTTPRSSARAWPLPAPGIVSRPRPVITGSRSMP